MEKQKIADNAKFIDILIDEIPKKDLEGMTTAISKNFEFGNMQKGKALMENDIAAIRYQFKLTYFDYKIKKSKWKNLYNKVLATIELPVQFDFQNLKQIKEKSFSDDSEYKEVELVLKCISKPVKTQIYYKGLSFLALIFSLTIIITEATIIFN